MSSDLVVVWALAVVLELDRGVGKCFAVEDLFTIATIPATSHLKISLHLIVAS